MPRPCEWRCCVAALKIALVHRGKLTHVGSRRNAESIRRKILDPASSIAHGYEKMAGIMPKTFGSMMNAMQLEALVQFLASHK